MVRRTSLAIAALLVASVLTGCSDSDEPPAAESPRPTPITQLEVDSIRLARVEFCDRLADSAVRSALGGPAESDQSWGNGDPVPRDGDTGTASGDVAHELGCAWSGPAGSTARAWVFARPVSAAFAGTLVRQAGQQKGCRAEAATTFGSPALLQTCTEAGSQTRVRRAGLFADTWLTCEVTGAPTDLPTRLDSWCATVVAALDTSR